MSIMQVVSCVFYVIAIAFTCATWRNIRLTKKYSSKADESLAKARRFRDAQ